MSFIDAFQADLGYKMGMDPYQSPVEATTAASPRGTRYGLLTLLFTHVAAYGCGIFTWLVIERWLFLWNNVIFNWRVG